MPRATRSQPLAATRSETQHYITTSSSTAGRPPPASDLARCSKHCVFRAPIGESASLLRLKYRHLPAPRLHHPEPNCNSVSSI